MLQVVEIHSQRTKKYPYCTHSQYIYRACWRPGEQQWYWPSYPGIFWSEHQQKYYCYHHFEEKITQSLNVCRLCQDTYVSSSFPCPRRPAPPRPHVNTSPSLPTTATWWAPQAMDTTSTLEHTKVKMSSAWNATKVKRSFEWNATKVIRSLCDMQPKSKGHCGEMYSTW